MRMKTTLLKNGKLFSNLLQEKLQATDGRRKTKFSLLLMLLAGLLYINTGYGQIVSSALSSPTQNGSISGSVDDPTFAYSQNSQYTVFDTNGETVRYFGFGLLIPSGVTVTGVEVLLRGNRADDRDLNISLTWNGGTTYTTARLMPGFGTTDATVTMGGSLDNWGHAFTIAELTSATNFGVRCQVPAAATGDMSLDHLQVRVYYANNISTFNTSGSFSVPNGVTSVTVDAWGAGAGGSNAAGTAGGGGAGAYTKGTITGLTGGNSVTIAVGTGGAIGAPTVAPGNFSRATFGATTITANGGLSTNSRTGGAGGAASAISGATTASFAGGDGGNGRSSTSGGGNEAGGGGGGSAFSNAAGGDGATGGSSTSANTTGGTGYASGGLGASADGSPNATAGSFVGGGGGGRGEGGGTSGTGANGQVFVSWCPNYSVSSTAAASPICVTSPTSVVTLTASPTYGLPIGTYTVTYNRSSPAATGLTATLTVSVDGTGTFTAVGLTTVGTATITVTNIAATITSCSSVISAGNISNTITINGTPTAAAGSAMSVCYAGGSIAITAGSTATNAATTTWSSSGTGSFANANSMTLATYTPSAADLTAGNVTLTLTATPNAPCAGNATSNKTLTMAQQPTALAGGSATICINQTAQVSGASSSNGTIVWTENGAGSITLGQGTLTPTYTPAAGDVGTAVTLTMTVSNSPCTAATATYTVNVVGAATAVAGTALTMCQSAGSVNVTAGSTSSNNAGITWSSSGTGSFANANSMTLATYTPSAADLNAGSVTITLTATGNSPCGNATSNKTLTLYKQPTATAGGSQTICQNQTATVSGATSSNGTIVWTENGAGSITLGQGTLTPTYTAAAGDAGNAVTLTMTVSNGTCTAATATYTVNVVGAATAVAGTAVTMCETAGSVNVTAGATSSNNSGVTWTSSGTGTFANANSMTLATYTPSAADLTAGSVTITLTATGNSPCGNATSNKTLTLYKQPTATAGGSQTICQNQTAQVSGATSSNGTINWTENGAGSITLGQGTLTPTYTAAAGDAGNAVTLTMTVSNGTCTPATATYTVNVLALPTATAGSAFLTCANSGFVNVASGSSASNNSGVLWTSNGTGTFTDANSLTLATYTPSAADILTGSVTFTLTAFGNGSCNNATSNKTLTILPVPVATGVAICQGQSSQAMTSSTTCPNNAPVTTAVRYPASGVNSGTGTAWTNPGNVISDNNSNASFTGSTSGNVTSQTLNATGYGFTIPANAVISGIQCTIGRSRSGGISGEAKDNSVRLIKAGSAVGDNKGFTSTNWGTSESAINYGGTADMWNATWTPAEVNASNFGVAFAADITQGFIVARTANVDYINLSVTYYIPGDLNWYTVSSGGTSIGSGPSFNPVGVAGSGLANTNTAGTTTYYVECSTVAGCRTPVTYTINTLPSVSFTGLNALYCQSAAPATLLANHAGGTFSGLGVTDNGNGTASFNPAIAGVGPHSVMYSYTDGNTCANSVVQNTAVNANVTYYADADTDGFGNAAVTSVSCTGAPAGFILDNTDCNDADNTKHTTFPFYADADGDTFGAGSLVSVCAVDANTPPVNYSLNNTDCLDSNALVYQSASLYNDIDGDGYNNGLQTVCYGATIPAGFSATTLGSDCNDNDATKHDSFDFYVDADGDGYGTGSAVSLCAVDANTPPLANYSVNNTDCLDSNALVYQSASLYNDVDGDGYDNGSQTVCYGATIPAGFSATTLGSDCNDNDATKHASFDFYVDADGDGYGTGSAVSLCAVDANTPPLANYSVNNSDCNDNDNTKHASFDFYADADGDGYGAGTALNLCAVNASTPPAPGLVSNNTDCDDTKAAVHPGATEIGYNLIDDDCDGLTDEGFPPKVTNMQSAMCDSVLPTIETSIIANLVSGAQGYRWRITTMSGPNVGQVQFLDTAIRTMKLTSLTSYAFATQYKVELGVYYAGFLQPYTPSACTVTTPSPTTQLISCGAVLTSTADPIYAALVPYAAGYRVRVTDPINPLHTQTIDRPIREFRMNNVTAFLVEYSKTYNVEVAIKNIDGTYLPYGGVCTVTTPVFPTTSLMDVQCDDYAVPSNATQIYAISYPGALSYTFSLAGPGLPVGGIEVTRPLRAFSLNEFTGLIPGATYNVKIRMVFHEADPIGPFGKVCTIVTPGLSRQTVKPEMAFNAVAYPNPFASDFNINVTTAMDQDINIKVYDMTGRLLETRNVKVSEMESLKVGDNYPSGVYNVIVSQGDTVKTLRVIKR
jgi:hypothetical protein